MIPLLLIAATGGLGAFLIWRAFTAQPTLADIQARLARPGRTASAPVGPSARDEIEHRMVQ
jgi:hypothetical protein